MQIIQNLVSQSKYDIKCPYAMSPQYITIHNTANDASARDEIAYMVRNDNEVSYHFAVDDKEIVQGLPLNRNGWHSGDGNGPGNRSSIGIEICWSLSGGPRFDQAELNAAKFTAQLLQERGWGVDRVRGHFQWANKRCPHRTLDKGWDRFLQLVTDYLKQTGPTPPSTDIEQMAKDVIGGKYGTGDLRRTLLGKYYDQVQARVNEMLRKPSQAEYYTVQSGDTLGAISRKFGTSVQQIQNWNGIANPNLIRVGERFRVR